MEKVLLLGLEEFGLELELFGVGFEGEGFGCEVFEFELEGVVFEGPFLLELGEGKRMRREGKRGSTKSKFRIIISLEVEFWEGKEDGGGGGVKERGKGEERDDGV